MLYCHILPLKRHARILPCSMSLVTKRYETKACDELILPRKYRLCSESSSKQNRSPTARHPTVHVAELVMVCFFERCAFALPVPTRLRARPRFHRLPPSRRHDAPAPALGRLLLPDDHHAGPGHAGRGWGGRLRWSRRVIIN